LGNDNNIENATFGQMDNTGTPPQYCKVLPMKSNVEVSDSGITTSRHSHGAQKHLMILTDKQALQKKWVVQHKSSSIKQHYVG
jgi:hypothetical protein